MDPIIMVRLGSDAAVWARTIVTWPGPGYDCRVGDTLSDDSLAGMARRVLDAAPDRFALAGVSMGGMVAMTIMGIAPERVTRLALFDTNARADTPEQIARPRATNDAMLAATDLRALAAPAIAYMVHPRAARDVHDVLSDMTVRVGADAYVRQNEAVAAREELSPDPADDRLPVRGRRRRPDDARRLRAGDRRGDPGRAIFRIISRLRPFAAARKARGDGDAVVWERLVI
ncbi:alpha/beta fold hydrolase [Sphingomonas sp. MMS24-JH45]